MLDAIIVGAGPQALFLLHEAKRNGLDVRCVIDGLGGGLQLTASQYYLHLGYFYRSTELTALLKEAREVWDRFLVDYEVPTRTGSSFFGFENEHSAQGYEAQWAQSKLPFAKCSPDEVQIFSGGAMSSFYKVNELWVTEPGFVSRIFGSFEEDCIHHSTVASLTADADDYRLTLTNGEGLRANSLVFAAGANNGDLALRTLNVRVPQQQRKCQVLCLEGGLPEISLLCPTRGHFITPYSSPSAGVSLRATYGFDPPIPFELNPPVDVSRLVCQEHSLFTDFPLLLRATAALRWHTAVKAEYLGDGFGVRPDKYSIVEPAPNAYVVWPTKFTLSPMAAREVVNRIKDQSENPSHSNHRVQLF